MYHRNKKLGLILGGGTLTETLINNCKKKKIKTYIIAIENNYSLKKIKPDIKIKYDHLGIIFNLLKKKNISQVILLGSIKKKPFLQIRPNLITFFYLIKIFFMYGKGDGELINKIIKIFKFNRIDIIDPRMLIEENLCDRKFNNLSRFKKIINKKKIYEYMLKAKEFGRTDKGQAIIVSDGKTVLTEDSNGTDHLIKKFILKENYKFSCLVKASKPNQDIRVDLPTIGPQTIKNMIKVGINGIIVEDKKTFIDKPNITYNLIKKNNIFFYAL